jgi:hypothetical protein
MIYTRNPCSSDAIQPNGYVKVAEINLHYRTGTKTLYVYTSALPMTEEDGKEVKRLKDMQREVNNRKLPIWA